MAEIPVECKSGFPLWAALLGLLALGALLWMLFAMGDDTPDYAEADLDDRETVVVIDQDADTDSVID
ncbi:MAG: hypothetical protein WBF53_16360 [Litorimonas sp.]